jgi:probable rRNA maturation factor
VNDVEVSSAGLEPPPWARRLARFARRVLRLRNIRNWDLSILLCDDPSIQSLNRRYRKLDAPTDVLAFPQTENPDPQHVGSSAAFSTAARRAAGDVVISLDTMRRNAGSNGVPEEEELKRLLIHGILHLEGMDHQNEEPDMLVLQERLLSRLKEEKVF